MTQVAPISNVPPDHRITIVYDEKGNRVAVDAYTDYYFTGNNHVRTIHVKPDGSLTVKSLSPDARKEVTLAEFIWSIYHETTIAPGYIVVQKKADLPDDPRDFSVWNLELVQKHKPKSLEAQRAMSRRRRKSA